MIKFFRLSILMAMFAVALTGCGDDEKENQSAIKPQSQEALTQTVFADQTDGKSGVSFVTTGPWTSTIKEGTLKAGTEPWVSIDPASGDKAGTYTITIKLEPNTTGEDRTANIIITCDDTDITITVTQKATTEDGSVPEPTTTTLTVSVENGSALNTRIDEVKVQIDADEYMEIAKGNYVNGGFTIALPNNFNNNFLSPIEESGLMWLGGLDISNTNARIAYAFLTGYKSGERNGMFWYEKHLSSGYYAMEIVYSDSNVTITGSTSDHGDTYSYSVSLKKGWNFVYVKVIPTGTSEAITYTMEFPGGMKWYWD